MTFQRQLQQLRATNTKWLAILLDPDKETLDGKFDLKIVEFAKHAHVLFVGGSLMSSNHLDQMVSRIKELCDLPVVLFPGSGHQLSAKADAMLYLSLISGRNAELLIGEHVRTAPAIKKMGIETVPTGYMLVESGVTTTAQYVSQTQPIPRSKPDIAVATALAGEMLGLKNIYLDGGSGADSPIPTEMISQVRQSIDMPLIVGGGIRNKQEMMAAWDAGADLIVVGTALELDATLLTKRKEALTPSLDIA